MSAAPPEWTQTESSIEDAKVFLREGNTIDFFERISRAILREKPEDIENYALQLVNDALQGNDIPLNLDFQPQSEDAHNYMHEKGLSEFVDAWVLALLEARPPSDQERMEFHKEYLEKRIEARGANTA